MANSKWQIANGFTLIELLLAMGIFATLIGISSINLISAQRKTSLSSAVGVFAADLKSQQIRAMVGEDEAGLSAADYGIHFETTSYTQFKGSYGTNNFVSDLPANTQFAPVNSDIIFAKGSGQIATETIVTIRDVNDGSQKEITINKLGVVKRIE